MAQARPHTSRSVSPPADWFQNFCQVSASYPQSLHSPWPGLDTVGDSCRAKFVDWDMVVSSELGNPELGRESVSGPGEAEPGFGAVESGGDMVSRTVGVDSGVVSGLRGVE